jgi:hypothetical protein
MLACFFRHMLSDVMQQFSKSIGSRQIEVSILVSSFCISNLMRGVKLLGYVFETHCCCYYKFNFLSSLLWKRRKRMGKITYMCFIPSLPLIYGLEIQFFYVNWTVNYEQSERELNLCVCLRPSIQLTMETESECDCLSWCSGHQERDNTSHQSLQENNPHWLIPGLQLQPSASCEEGGRRNSDGVVTQSSE